MLPVLKITRRSDGIYQKIETQISFEKAIRDEIAAEKAAREAADASLAASLDQEKALRAQEDQKIKDSLTKETSERTVADDALMKKIAEVEAKVGTGGGTVPPDLEQTIQEISAGLADLETKKFLIPIEEVTNDGQNPIPVTTNTYKLRYSGPGEIFAGKVDVLDQAGEVPMIGPDNKEITATVDATGTVVFSRPPNAAVRLTFGVLMPFSDLPQEFLKVRFKSGLEKDLGMLIDVRKLKEDMAIEQITPSGLYAQATGSTVYLTFTYQDRPEISHFILERYNPATGQWEPYDGAQGIVTK